MSVSLTLSQTPVYTDTGLVHCAGSGVPPVHAPAFAGTQCAYPCRDGQAELTWVAGCIPRWYTRERSPISVLTWLSIRVQKNPGFLKAQPSGVFGGFIGFWGFIGVFWTSRKK